MSNLYTTFLFLHSWNRWIILISGLLLIISLIINLKNKDVNYSFIKTGAVTFLSSLHLQFLIGIIIYFFLSPFTQMALNDFGEAMKNSDLRYWAVEHSFINLVAIILAQVGYSKAKRRVNNSKKMKTLFIWMGFALIFILIAVPMGIMGPERPWFRF